MTFNSLTLHKPFLFFFLAFFSLKSSGQGFSEKKYPQGYFIYPVGAQKIALAANFGELRPDHFHMGLDCKTDRRENLPVFAAADGYISRVKIEPFGFGRAIYINHPNGYTTLYAHLNQFYPALEAYVKQQQYLQESWQVFLDIPSGMFPVKQHQEIARSGNTGGSQGPHTHFEIRETKTDKNVNPLLFGLPIPDRVPPTITSLAIYNRHRSTYEQQPKIVGLVKSTSGYGPVSKLISTPSDMVSFGIIAFDQLSGSLNHNGIFEAILYDNEKAVVGFRLDHFSYDETRYVNANIDYKTKMNGGPYIQHLSRLPGNREGIYKDFTGDGVINLSDDQVHHIKIMVTDANKNVSFVYFDILHENAPNTIEIKNGKTHNVEFEPLVRNIYENDELSIVTDERALYDSFTLHISSRPSINPSSLSDVYTIGSALIPLQTPMVLKIKPPGKMEHSAINKVIIKRTWKGKNEVVKAIKEMDMYKGTFRNFGDFELLVDDEPPVITASFVNGANLAGKMSLVINIKDDNETVKNFKALLDGHWIRFTNDKEHAFIYNFDEKCTTGKHLLDISVEDEAGNTTKKSLTFTR